MSKVCPLNPTELFDLPEDGPRHWYAAYTKPCHEKRVAEHLRIRNVDFFLPLYSSARRWNNGCNVTLQSPLFPSYVFVHILPGQRLRVLELSSVLSIAGSSHEATPLPDEEIERLRSGLLQANAEPHPVLTVGERVRIRRGPLEGLQGVVSRQKNRFRVILTLELIMKSVAVEVCADDTEPIGKPEQNRSVMAAYAR